jgi:hypothetical protein
MSQSDEGPQVRVQVGLCADRSGGWLGALSSKRNSEVLHTLGQQFLHGWDDEWVGPRRE